MTPEEIHATRALRVLYRVFAAAVFAIVAFCAWQAPAKLRADLSMIERMKD